MEDIPAHKRRKVPEPAETEGPPGYIPSPSVAALHGLAPPPNLVGPRNMDISDTRDGSKDWKCPKCANVNFSGRRWCNRCREPLPLNPEFAGIDHASIRNPRVGPGSVLERHAWPPRPPTEAA